MKFSKKTRFIYLFLTLMFSVAVSGGCGGGGSHYSGDSSQNTTPEDVTPEIDRQDIILPEIEEPVLSDEFGDENADDEYGAGKIKINSFVLLNKTTWKIENIKITDPSTIYKNYEVIKGNSHNTDTITFLISGNKMDTMAWATQDAKRTAIHDDLTVQFVDPDDGELTAPILRSAKFSLLDGVYITPEIKRNGLTGTEIISIRESFTDTPLVAKKIFVKNQFTDSNKSSYMSQLELSRVDNFSILDQTDWQIKKIQVFEGTNDAQDYMIKSAEKITLRTNVSGDNAGVLDFVINDKTKSESLIAELIYNTKSLSAPILRHASGFKYTGKQNGNEIFEAKFPEQILPKNDRNKDEYLDRELLYVSDYGPNANIVIRNSFYLKDDDNIFHLYYVTLYLEPYKSK